MSEGLNKEVNRGKVLATILAEHLDDMRAENCEIPVEARGKKYVCKCEVEKPKSVVCPDIDGGHLVGKIKFQGQDSAKEYADVRNDNKIIRTPIPFHNEECCGCADFYFSTLKQEIIVICNECGLKRKLMMNNDELSIIGPTLPFDN